MIELIRLIRKHFVLLIFTPLFLAGLVFLFTKAPVYKFSSETTLYTGIASGSSVQMDKSFSYFANNTAFDNLINVITSRETQREVGLRLLAQHLLLNGPNAHYISNQHYKELMKITPAHIKTLVVRKVDPSIYLEPKKKTQPPPQPKPSSKSKTENITHVVKAKETLFSISQKYGLSVDQMRKMNHLKGNGIRKGQTLIVGQQVAEVVDTLPSNDLASYEDTTESFSFSDLDSVSSKSMSLPPGIDRAAFEQTVANLDHYMRSSDTNFLYKLLYFGHPHYSIKAISGVGVKRIASSDLVKLAYESNDPGICQQTLALITEVCINNYKLLKENRSDAVVKYFEYQLKQAADRLKIGEDKLLQFNKDNNIINYYEQSKAVANVKENLDVEFNNMRIKLAGLQASIRRIEEKLGIQQQIQLKSNSILDLRNKLSVINSKIATIESIGLGAKTPDDQLIKLKTEAEKLKDQIRSSVNDLYSYTNSIEGLPVKKLLEDWIANVIDYEETKAGLAVLGERIQEFQKQYAIYAPAGANIKRIEREINVSEQEFLEILHGLNLAKLKVQDAELSATLKAVDPPFYPISPNPTKRKMLIIVAALVGFILVLGTILAMEYFDDTLKDHLRASKIIGFETIGIFPKILLQVGTLNFLFVANRLLEMALQRIELLTSQKNASHEPTTILLMSTLSNEGKTVIGGNLALKLKKQGKRILYLNFSRDSLRLAETSQIGYSDDQKGSSTSGFIKTRNRSYVLSRLLGYGDNRIDPASPFLDRPEYNLAVDEYSTYLINSDYYSAKSILDLAQKSGFTSYPKPDYIFVEIPPILYYVYPTPLVASADLSILVSRANRSWSTADQGALDAIKKTTDKPITVFVNGVSLQVVETVLGDLPKKRSRLRRIFKNIVRLQFHSRHQP